MMNETLSAALTKEELALAAAIGAQKVSLSERIQRLFSDLPDVLLNAEEVKQLLACSESRSVVEETLREQCERQVLEVSTTTSRPLDDRENIPLYRDKSKPVERLKLMALESELGDGSTRHQFTCEGRLLRSIARIDRLDAVSGEGNQRGEIRKHVERIAEGIRAHVQVPTSVLLVLLESRTYICDGAEESPPPESFVVVRPLSDWITVDESRQYPFVQKFRQVELDFPFRRAAFDEEKSALLVDGQQRTAALALVEVEKVKSVQLSVNAVMATEEQAKQVFQVANSTQKIETQFSRSLLATMQSVPGYLRTEQNKALAAKTLVLEDTTSPFYQIVQYPGTKLSRRSIIAYNSLFQAISIFADSALPVSEARVLHNTIRDAFNIVRETWPNAWGKKPADSRLMHGVGLRAVAALIVFQLEQACAKHGNLQSAAWAEVRDVLDRLKHKIVWTDEDAGTASTTVRKVWREQISNRQNTSQDISALTAFLKKECMALVMEASKKGKAPKADS